jgi:hypothetical protein
MDARIVKVWRTGTGAVQSVDMTAADGARWNVRHCLSADGMVWVLSWSDVGSERNAWAHPELYGFERWYCPGHGGTACQYGACDEIRYTGPVDVAAFEAAQSRARLTRYAHGDVGYRLQG